MTDQILQDQFLLSHTLMVADSHKAALAPEKVREAVKDENAEILVIAAKIESDIAELESYEERQMFLEEMGLEESGVVRLIQSAYSLLNLRTYFTAGADECRAAGKLGIEGKEYVVQDGDIMHFLFNV